MRRCVDDARCAMTRDGAGSRDREGQARRGRSDESQSRREVETDVVERRGREVEICAVSMREVEEVEVGRSKSRIDVL